MLSLYCPIYNLRVYILSKNVDHLFGYYTGITLSLAKHSIIIYLICRLLCKFTFNEFLFLVLFCSLNMTTADGSISLLYNWFAEKKESNCLSNYFPCITQIERENKNRINGALIVGRGVPKTWFYLIFRTSFLLCFSQMIGIKYTLHIPFTIHHSRTAHSRSHPQPHTLYKATSLIKTRVRYDGLL